MPVTTDITATYFGPGRVMKRLLETGQREDRALVILMAFCVLVFFAQLPRLSREAHLTGQELNMLLGGTSTVGALDNSCANSWPFIPGMRKSRRMRS